jgi:hypothetical protein
MKVQVTIVKQCAGEKPLARYMQAGDPTNPAYWWSVRYEVEMVLAELHAAYQRNPGDCRMVVGLRPAKD